MSDTFRGNTDNLRANAAASRRIPPAQLLLGRTLEGDWGVVRRVGKEARGTGGCFSHGYIVRSSSGEEAFLKALDITKPFGGGDLMEHLQAMTAAFLHECDLCERCRDERMSRVVRILGHGIHYTDPDDRLSAVPFIVFELGEGDVRSRLDAADRLDLAWGLRTLHQVAVGIRQLHSRGIAHQDLKPSNAVVFPEVGAKVADLGCASTAQGGTAPRDHLNVAGALAYAPPELLYGHLDPDWRKRRLGCDLYLLGSMVVFVFTGVSMTALLAEKLDPNHIWHKWGDSYAKVRPYVRDAFDLALETLERHVPTALREDVMAIVGQLCDPDPELRGHPAERIGHHNRYSLERYVSTLNELARKAELNLIRD